MANGGRDHHVVTVEEVELMVQKMKDMPKLLNNSAGRSSCCIFRVPQSLVEINPKAYQPHILSIGPYHHGQPHLQMIEEHKWRFIKDLLDRTPPNGNGLDHYLKVVASMEGPIRESYSETLSSIASRDLIAMMVLDGLFIIELFCKVEGLVGINVDDPIFSMTWVLFFLMRDLLRLENQIPYFVLQKLFDESKATRKESHDSSLAALTLGFFNSMLRRPNEIIKKYSNNLNGKHLLDLFRKSFIPLSQETPNRKRLPTNKKGENMDPFLQLIPSAKKLHVAGVEFKAREEAETFLDIKFHRGVLQIPHLIMDDFTTSLFLNCVAFEQCYSRCSNHFTAYATFMGCLINTPIDAGLLIDHNIIETYFGTDEEVAHFFINVGKDVVFDIEDNYLREKFWDVNKYYRNDWHVEWAGFKYTYFDTPWSFLSALAALVLLILTMTQTFFAVFSYVHPAGGGAPAPTAGS